jgi:hypothetical protein
MRARLSGKASLYRRCDRATRTREHATIVRRRHVRLFGPGPVDAVLGGEYQARAPVAPPDDAHRDRDARDDCDDAADDAAGERGDIAGTGGAAIAFAA